MTDLINGLGGTAGFGEQQGPVRDDQVIGPVDITSVFEGGLRVLGRTYTGLFIDENGAVALANPGDDTFFFIGDNPEFSLFGNDHLVEDGELVVTPGGTSQGTNSIYYDLDPDSGTVTVTWDDVQWFFSEDDARNAYQIRFLDLPGGSEGSFAVEYRYEAINWGEDFFAENGFNLKNSFGTFGRSFNAFDIVDPEDEAGLLALPDAGVIRFEIDGDSVTSNLPGQEVIPVFGTPIEGTDGADRLIGTDGSDLILGGLGRDTIRPGEGDDVISLQQGLKTIVGTADALLGDTLDGFIDVDRLLFEGEAFGGEDVSVGEFEQALIFDIDGDGAADGEITVDLFDFPSRSVLTATTAKGTWVTTVADLPDPEDFFFFSPRDYDLDLNKKAYLRGDGQADFALRLDGLSTLDAEGTALGYYTYDRNGAISEGQLLTTDVRAEGDAEFLLDDIGRGENIGLFIIRPDEAGVLDGVDSFDFVDETGGEASLDDFSYVFAEVNGEILSADLIHVADNRLNIDQRDHALIGMTDRAGLTIGIEDTLYDSQGDFDDVVLSIERLALDLA